MRTLGAVLFEGFELLDLFGPLEMFGLLGDDVRIVMVAEAPGPVKSGQGPSAVADVSFAAAPHLDLVLVPGGPGTRVSVEDRALMQWLGIRALAAERVMSVCTGAALLARAGVLDGHRATTNKAAWAWATGFGTDVDWVAQARWVADGRTFTSSGVSAGMDMALAAIAALYGEDRARQVAVWAEYDWHDSPDWDPFAAIHGLV